MARYSVNPGLEYRSKKWRVLAVAGFGLALAVVAVLPLDRIEGPTCPLRFWLGLPCLFCGGTRATQALLHGQWERALYLNPWTSLALFPGAVWAIIALAEVFTGHRLFPRIHWSAWKVAGIVVVLLVCWGIHVRSALLTPKPELLNDHGAAAEIRAWFLRA